MSYETRDYTGRLFKNEKKAKDTHPDYTGSAVIGGVEHFMDAWIKRSESGRTWMSFSFKAKHEHPPQPTAPPARKAPTQPTDDDIPF